MTRGQPKAMKNVQTLEDLAPDRRNANRGTERGRGMVESSLRKYGAGRSILVDRDGEVIAGNKTLEAAADIGLPIRVVKTDGKELVVVQREDLDLTEEGTARELAYADNRASEVGLEWDAEILLADINQGVDLSGLWKPYELAGLFDASEEIDYSDEWRGMPEYEQEDQLAWQSIKVHFANEVDRSSFAELVSQSITDKTKYIWYPKQLKESYTKLQWTDES